MFDLHHAEWFMSTVWRYKDVFTPEEESFLRREFNLLASTKLWGTDYRPFVVFVAFWRFFYGQSWTSNRKWHFCFTLWKTKHCKWKYIQIYIEAYIAGHWIVIFLMQLYKMYTTIFYQSFHMQSDLSALSFKTISDFMWYKGLTKFVLISSMI